MRWRFRKTQLYARAFTEKKRPEKGKSGLLIADAHNHEMVMTITS
jgi:hypothetical protein